MRKKSIMKVYNDNSLVNLSNSILKCFDTPTFHDSIPEIDEKLKGHKKVVAVLFDGMGQNITRMHLKENSFIRTHYVTTINSTFPPTTAAATTAFLTGKYPIETGWLSWSQYFKDYNRNIILFRSKDYNTFEDLIKPGETPIALRYFPLKKLPELINEAHPNIATKALYRFPIEDAQGPKTFLSGAHMINKFLKNNKECFLYYYWDTPDGEMHEYGIDNHIAHRRVLKIQRFMKRVTKKNPDTVFILFADHGHINVEFTDICDHEDLYSLLYRPMTLDKRSPTFFVKEENHQKFVELFNKYYGNDFDLFTKQEVLDMKLFGEGEPAKGVLDAFGEFVAIAKTNKVLYGSKEMDKVVILKGHHAGGTKEERLIDVSMYNVY